MNKMNFETKRLIMRPFELTDKEALFAYLSDEEVVRYEPYKPFSPDQIEEEVARRTNNPDFLAVCLKDGQLIGNLYFSKSEFNSWEIGYVFNKKFWKQGYALESLRGLVNYAFQEKAAHRLIAMCNPENTASWKLLERAAFRREGCLKKNVYFWKDEENNPVWQDTYLYGVLKEEKS